MFKFTERRHGSPNYPKKCRHLFPDTTVEVVSLMESGDHAIAEWKLVGPRKLRLCQLPNPGFLVCDDVVRVEHEKWCNGRTTTTAPHLGAAWLNCSRRNA